MPSALKKWRERKGLTQVQVAAGVGVHPMYISAIERGKRTPGMTVATAIREFSGGELTLDMLIPVKLGIAA